jgi:hypothetical protein
MSRGYQPEEHLDPRLSPERRGPSPGEPRKRDEVREQASSDASHSRGHDQDRVASRSTEPRRVYELRGRTYRLRNSEIATMVELGTFRAVASKDLAKFVYDGNKDRMRPDVENLFRQGLIEMKSIPYELIGSRQLLTLTKNGHRFLVQTKSAGNGQTLYHGFKKPREAHHDADLYRLYHKAAANIESQGGRNLRVVLDYELKKRLYRDLAKFGKERNSASAKHGVAETHGLKVVRGKIPVPDVRIEYETSDGERTRVDLELATGHYRLRNLAEKVFAGFAIYAHADEASKLRRILDQRELTAEILSL